MRRQSIEGIMGKTRVGVFLFRFMARQEDKIKGKDRDKKKGTLFNFCFAAAFL